MRILRKKSVLLSSGQHDDFQYSDRQDRHLTRSATGATAVLVGVALTLSACSSEPGASDIDTENMGNATPAASEPANNPAGSTFTIEQTGFNGVKDMERAGKIIAAKDDSGLLIGDLSQFKDNQAKFVPTDESCGDLTATDDTFVLPCPKGVYLIDAAKPTMDTLVPTEEPVTTAALTEDGVLVAGIKDQAKVSIFRDKKLDKTIDVEDPTDQMIAVPTDSDSEKKSAVVRINRKYTLIQDIDLEKNRPGAILRAGLGVGEIAGGPHGLVLASDTIGNQLQFFFADDIIRAQKVTPVANSPWAVAWDNKNGVAWVSSTKENKLVSYDPSAGDLKKKDEYSTIANVDSLLVLDDGTILMSSSTGNDIQVIPAS